MKRVILYESQPKEDKMASKNQKYGEILGEYKTVLLLAEMLDSKGIALKKSLSYYKNEYNKQNAVYRNKKGYSDISKYIKDMNGVFNAAASNMCQFVLSQNPIFVDIDNTTKSNRNNIQKVKIDIELNIDGTIHDISLKQYKKDAGVQLCSGTYSSSLCSLAFQRIGQGKFQNNGKGFLSKSKDVVRQQLVSTYGHQLGSLYDDLMILEDSVKPYQVMPKFPGMSVWSSYCKTTGAKAVKIFDDMLTIISSTKCLKQDILTRAGLNTNHHILVSCDMKKPKVYSTLTNAKFANNIKLLQDPATTLKIASHGQGINFDFIKNNSVICNLHMPLTINRNGAFHLPKNGKSRICKKSGGKTILAGQLRPGKAKEMATSTNLWLEIKKLA
jgi:hypothetical protein